MITNILHNLKSFIYLFKLSVNVLKIVKVTFNNYCHFYHNDSEESININVTIFSVFIFHQLCNIASSIAMLSSVDTYRFSLMKTI